MLPKSERESILYWRLLPEESFFFKAEWSLLVVPLNEAGIRSGDALGLKPCSLLGTVGDQPLLSSTFGFPLTNLDTQCPNTDKIDPLSVGKSYLIDCFLPRPVVPGMGALPGCALPVRLVEVKAPMKNEWNSTEWGPVVINDSRGWFVEGGRIRGSEDNEMA